MNGELVKIWKEDNVSILTASPADESH